VTLIARAGARPTITAARIMTWEARETCMDKGMVAHLEFRPAASRKGFSKWRFAGMIFVTEAGGRAGEPGGEPTCDEPPASQVTPRG
jgi:hypothetical protein